VPALRVLCCFEITKIKKICSLLFRAEVTVEKRDRDEKSNKEQKWQLKFHCAVQNCDLRGEFLDMRLVSLADCENVEQKI
jgi:hypothetical protein